MDCGIVWGRVTTMSTRYLSLSPTRQDLTPGQLAEGRLIVITRRLQFGKFYL